MVLLLRLVSLFYFLFLVIFLLSTVSLRVCGVLNLLTWLYLVFFSATAAVLYSNAFSFFWRVSCCEQGSHSYYVSSTGANQQRNASLILLATLPTSPITYPTCFLPSFFHTKKLLVILPDLNILLLFTITYVVQYFLSSLFYSVK